MGADWAAPLDTGNRVVGANGRWPGVRRLVAFRLGARDNGTTLGNPVSWTLAEHLLQSSRISVFSRISYHFFCCMTLTCCYCLLWRSCLNFTRRAPFDESLYRYAWTQGKWSQQQKWVSVLLVGLFFFNNPFFAAQVFDCPRATFVQSSPPWRSFFSPCRSAVSANPHVFIIVRVFF